MSARIVANNFADLITQLKDATPEQLKATEAYWAARPGVIASEYRLFVQGEITYRQATAALVAEMRPPTRWEAQR